MQIKVRDVGYDSNYTENICWVDLENSITVFDDDKEKIDTSGSEWEEFGYVDRWETVMVSFTEKGAQEYIDQNGHNHRHEAFRQEVRIYAKSFNRCPEMISIRDFLMSL